MKGLINYLLYVALFVLGLFFLFIVAKLLGFLGIDNLWIGIVAFILLVGFVLPKAFEFGLKLFFYIKDKLFK